MTEQPIPILIGIVGRFGTGKSTLAEMLAEEIPDARVVAFADELKDAVTMIYARSMFVDETRLRPWLEDRKGTIFGPLLQGTGELMREWHGPEFWIGHLAAKLPNRAIVADVRHHNEAAWIKSRGGLLVAISGPCRREGDQRSSEHPSERFVDEIAADADLVVRNDEGIDKLRGYAALVAATATSLAENGETP